jgi:hypothetical protein
LQSSTVSFRIDETATIPLYPQVIQRTLNVSEQNFVTGSALRTTFQCVAASQAFIDFFSSPGSLSTEGVERERKVLLDSIGKSGHEERRRMLDGESGVWKKMHKTEREEKAGQQPF